MNRDLGFGSTSLGASPRQDWVYLVFGQIPRLRLGMTSWRGDRFIRRFVVGGEVCCEKLRPRAGVVWVVFGR